MRNFLNNKHLAQNIFASAIWDFVKIGIPTIVTWLFTHLAAVRGLALHWVIFFGSAVFLILAMAFRYFLDRRQQPQEATMLEIPAETTEVMPAAEVGQLKERIKELEASNATAAKDVERLSRETANANKSAETHSVRANLNQALLDKYNWIHKMTDEHARDIAQHVQVERIRVCYHAIEAYPYIVFAVDVDNRSIFDVLIDNEVAGYIEIGGEPLREGVRIWNEPVRVSALRKGSITLKQRLTKSEYDFIIKCRERDEAVFYFDKLIITSSIDRQDVPSSPQALILPNRPPIRYEPAKE